MQSVANVAANGARMLLLKMPPGPRLDPGHMPTAAIAPSHNGLMLFYQRMPKGVHMYALTCALKLTVAGMSVCIVNGH